MVIQHDNAFISNPSLAQQSNSHHRGSSSLSKPQLNTILTSSQSLSISSSIYPSNTNNYILSTSTIPSILQIPLHPPRQPPAASARTIILWYRFDLRIHDHAALTHAIEEVTFLGNILPVYIINPNDFCEDKYGLRRTARYSAQFLLQSLTDLRQSLRQRGSDLFIFNGIPETLLPNLARRVHADAVLYHRDVGHDKLSAEYAVKRSLNQINVSFHGMWTNTLYEKDDLPFSLEDMPGVYSTFRASVQSNAIIRESLPAPDSLPSAPKIPSGDIPTLTDLGFAELPKYRSEKMRQRTGGEQEAIKLLCDYAKNSCYSPEDRLLNMYITDDFGATILPWLALGCISPRYIYKHLSKVALKVQHTNTFFELMLRDYFRFFSAKSALTHREQTRCGSTITQSLVTSSF